MFFQQTLDPANVFLNLPLDISFWSKLFFAFNTYVLNINTYVCTLYSVILSGHSSISSECHFIKKKNISKIFVIIQIFTLQNKQNSNLRSLWPRSKVCMIFGLNEIIFLKPVRIIDIGTHDLQILWHLPQGGCWVSMNTLWILSVNLTISCSGTCYSLTLQVLLNILLIVNTI